MTPDAPTPDDLAMIPQRIADEITSQRLSVKKAIRNIGGDLATESERLDVLQVALALVTGRAIGVGVLDAIYPLRRARAIAYLADRHRVAVRGCGHLGAHEPHRFTTCPTCRPPHEDRRSERVEP
jgi:hypothetical protein